MVKAMKNKEKYNLAHLHIVEHAGTTRLDSNITYVEIEYNGKIVKEYACTNEAGIKKFLEWLEEEYKPNILGEKEKEYLSAVIKPFRDMILWIKKDGIEGYKEEWISIGYKSKNTNSFGVATLPNFKTGTIYKGMEAYKEYNLKELGL